jgi:hypothetical protein
MTTVREMMEHIFTSDDKEEECLPRPVQKRCRESEISTKNSLGMVGSVGSDDVSTSQSSMSEIATGNASSQASLRSSNTKDLGGRTTSEIATWDASQPSSTFYDTEDSSHTCNAAHSGKKRGANSKPTPVAIPVVQEDMDPTHGAVAALTTGVMNSNRDVNAVFEDGKVECLAGQLIMEDEVDGKTQCQMFWEKYYPILRVQRIVWYSSFSKGNSMGVPRMVFFVSDGLDEMPMVASTRKHSLLSSFWDKKGPYETGVLRQDRIFKLIDYHMGLKKDPKSGNMVPCIFVEKVKPQPKRNMKKFRTIRALVKAKIFK